MELSSSGVWLATAFISTIIIIIISLTHFVVMNRAPRPKKKNNTMDDSTIKNSAIVIGALDELKDAIDTKKFRRVFNELFNQVSSIMMFQPNTHARYLLYMKRLDDALKVQFQPTDNVEDLREISKHFFKIKSIVKDLKTLEFNINWEYKEAKRKEKYVVDAMPELEEMFEQAQKVIGLTNWNEPKLNRAKMQNLRATKNAKHILYDSVLQMERDFTHIIEEAKQKGKKTDDTAARLNERTFLDNQRLINGHPY